MANIENLIENVDNQIIKIRTKSLDISFNELYDMYKSEELKINPEYQRLFRWDEEKQSRFIESLILEMPVPPIFVIEVDDGVYELIDGLQRISSYLHFRGVNFKEPTETLDFLELSGCDIAKELNGYTFETLPKVLQIKIKRSFVRMEVIRKESESNLKYYMFKRLNTGGESLSEQEIRNCTIRLLDSKAIDFIDDCSKNSNFKNVICKIREEEIMKKKDQELVLRFFAIKNNIENYKYPLSDYLTSFLEKMADDKAFFNFEYEKNIFESTFDLIYKILGEYAFSSKTSTGDKNDFVSFLFDGIAIAFAQLISDDIEINDKHFGRIREKINEIKQSDDLKPYKTGVRNSVEKRIELFKKGVEETID